MVRVAVSARILTLARGETSVSGTTEMSSVNFDAGKTTVFHAVNDS
jgi:hypothetical protein